MMNTANEMNVAMNKIRKYSKTAKILSVVIAGLLLFAGVSLVAVMVVVGLYPEQFTEFLRDGAEQGLVNTPTAELLHEIALGNKMALGTLHQEIVINAVQCILSAVVMIISAKLFGWIYKNGTPFHTHVVKQIKIIAVLLIVSGIFNLAMVLLGVVVYLLAQIFSYGVILQQESDETL